jgi:starch phosphorylase
MRESMARLTPRFSTNRSVREYTEGHYLPAAAAYRLRAADKGAGGRDIVRWKDATNEKWSALRLGEVRAQSRGDEHLLEVPVSLGDLDPAAVRVELYADGVAGKEPVRQEMKQARSADGGSGRFVYSATVSAVRPAADYTVRITPKRDGLAVPLECNRILWQR